MPYFLKPRNGYTTESVKNGKCDPDLTCGYLSGRRSPRVDPNFLDWTLTDEVVQRWVPRVPIENFTCWYFKLYSKLDLCIAVLRQLRLDTSHELKSADIYHNQLLLPFIGRLFRTKLGHSIPPRVIFFHLFWERISGISGMRSFMGRMSFQPPNHQW